MTSTILPTSQTPLLAGTPHRATSCAPRLDAPIGLDQTDETLYDQARGRISPAMSLVAPFPPPRAESCPPVWVTPQEVSVDASVLPTTFLAETRAWWPMLLFAVALGVFAGKNYAPGQKL